MQQNIQYKSNVLYLKIGGFVIQTSIEPQQRKKSHIDLSIDIKKLFSGYIVKKPKSIDFKIIIRKDPFPIILRKGDVRLAYFYREYGNKIETFIHVSPLQFFFLMSEILNKLLNKEGAFIFHTSAVKIGNKAYLFTGRSGAGKSTISQFAKPKYTLLGDDNIIVRRDSATNQYLAYQTPFNEKNDIGKRKKGGCEISKIFFLTKSKELNVKKITDKEWLLKTLLKQVLVDKKNQINFTDRNKKLFMNLLSFVGSFNEFYWLSFPKNKKVVNQFYKGLSNEALS